MIQLELRRWLSLSLSHGFADELADDVQVVGSRAQSIVQYRACLCLFNQTANAVGQLKDRRLASGF